MSMTLVKSIYGDPESYKDQIITLAGWVRTVRASKSFGFIELNDGTFFKNIQIVYEDNLDNFKEISRFNVGSAIQVTGKLVLTPEAKQPFEVKAERVELVGSSTPDYPLQKKRHSLEFLREIAHLRPRSNTFQRYLGYDPLQHMPSISSSMIGFRLCSHPHHHRKRCRRGREMFKLTTLDLNNLPLDESGKVDYSQDFFGKEVSLTVSGQLEGEAYAHAFRKIYTFGPTFRAENSNTARHAAEFWMLEPEVAFADLEDNMALAEEMLKYIISYVLEHAPEEMEFFNRFIEKGLLDRLNLIVNSDFERITYTEAMDILKKSGVEFAFPVEWGCDLQTEHERYLTEKVFKKPVFVTDYPKDIKAFYMRLNDDGKTVAAMDRLVPGVGEIIGGSQREERLDLLEKRIAEMGMNREDYWWYLDLRRYGGTKHAGYGLGFERAIMYMTGMSNIRDVIPFPRTVGSAEF